MKLGRLFLFTFFLSVYSIQSIAQSIDFIIPDTVCLNENISIQNISSSFDDYSWDFCEGDLKIPPLATSKSYSELNIPVGTSLIHADGLWYGFVCNISSNEIVRLDFGQNLTNTEPAKNNLGNIGGELNQPQDIKVVKDNGVYYAFTYNRGSNQLVRINFGVDLTNTNPSSDILLTGNGYINGGLDMEFDGSSWVLALTNSNTLTLISLGSSAGNIPSSGDIMSTTPISGIDGIGDVKLIREDGNWFGIAVGFNSRTVHRLSFGNSLFTDPTADQISLPNFSASGLQPYGITGAKEDGDWIFFLSTIQGSFPRINFGTNITNNSVAYDNLGNFSMLSNTLKVDMAVSDSRWVALTSNWTNTTFYMVEFPQASCNFNKSFSSSVSDTIQSILSGSRTVTLRARSNNGLIAQKTKSILINNTEAPSINIQNDNVCVASTTTFIGLNNSGDAISRWDWDFGDGDTSMEAQPQHIFAEPGIYQVKLVVESEDGCSNFIEKSIQIYPAPQAAFALPTGIICSFSPITFQNLTPGEYGDVISWEWDFNGEGSSTEREPVFAFSTGGEKLIRLTARIPGCEDVVEESLVVVAGPSVAFDGDDACLGESISFENLTTGDNITGYVWDFGDGYTSTLENPVHLFENTGSYVVSLRASNANGCENSFVKTIRIRDLPEADFNFELACSDAPVRFFDNSLAPNANITSWEWNVFDSNSNLILTSEEQNPTLQFPTGGSYRVSLEVTNNFGCSDNKEEVIEVIGQPETMIMADIACPGNESTISLVIITEDGEAPESITWQWQGQSLTQNSINFNNIASGSYPITTLIRFENRCELFLSDTIVVPTVPQASFNFEIGCRQDPVIFRSNGANLATSVSKKWYLGTNQIGAGEEFSWFPPNSGTYSIRLEVENEDGCTSTLTREVVIGAGPQARFTVNSNTGVSPFMPTIVNQSQNANSFIWISGILGGSSRDETSPTFRYETPGRYKLELIAFDEGGCSDTTFQMIDVVQPVWSLSLESFNAIESNGILNFSVNLRNTGNIPISELEFELSFSNKTRIREKIRENIVPGIVQLYNLGITMNTLANPNLEFVCVKLIAPAEISQNRITNSEECETITDKLWEIADIYPNPAREEANLDIILKEAQNIEIELVNTTGNTLFKKTYTQVIPGLNTFLLDLKNYPSGVYFILIRHRGELKRQRLVVR